MNVFLFFCVRHFFFDTTPANNTSRPSFLLFLLTKANNIQHPVSRRLQRVEKRKKGVEKKKKSCKKKNFFSGDLNSFFFARRRKNDLEPFEIEAKKESKATKKHSPLFLYLQQ